MLQSHNLVYLESVIGLGIDDAERDLLAELTAYYIEGRYPTYKAKLSSLVDQSKANDILLRAQVFSKWLNQKVML